jgi:hypothetical protein
MLSIEELEKSEEVFKKRRRSKKQLNMVISFVIFFACVIAVYDSAVIRHYDLTDRLRYMTWLSSIYTALLCFICGFVNLVELYYDSELTSRLVYFMRLSCATNELVVLLVVIYGLLPFVPDHPDFTSVTGFIMHVFMPILTPLSFAFNDAPIGKLKWYEPIHGTWFITLYALIMIPMILSGTLPREKVPYSFLLINEHSLIYNIAVAIAIYAIGYFLAVLLSRLNRRLSWVWFKDIARK